MRNYIVFLLLVLSFLTTITSYAGYKKTQRIPLFSNEQVNVWQTIIYPTNKQILKMHRHDYNRVVVALDNGTLQVTNDKGKIHYLKLAKGKAYYLKKDIPGELHRDKNISPHLIKVLVIELKN